MVQKTNSGATAARKLDLSSNLRLWEPAAKDFLDGKSKISCPLCLKGLLNITAVCGPDRVGFLLMTCPVCGKSSNFSRIKFPASVKTESF